MNALTWYNGMVGADPVPPTFQPRPVAGGPAALALAAALVRGAPVRAGGRAHNAPALAAAARAALARRARRGVRAWLRRLVGAAAGVLGGLFVGAR